ncbi:MAG: alanine racemase [Candidatus Omnitrophica bacterium]|nr:alanine racemase [Candidatus Omnitrophota bacterium]
MDKINFIGYRPTWAEVNLGNILHNFKEIKGRVAPNTKIMVTVKADAYGHGLIPVSQKLVSAGVDFLGVASIDEGIKLRESGINLPILILGLILKEDIDPVFEYKLTPSVCDEELAVSLNNFAKSRSEHLNLHVKVDTGMGRIGVLHQEADALIKKISKLRFVNIEGVFTHFPFADLNKDFTLYQIKLFEKLIQKLNKLGIKINLFHAANSMGLIDYNHSHLNMVRPGLVIYGLSPKEGLEVNLKPVLSLKTRVIYVKKVPKGYGISYGHDYITKKPTQIVTIPIGYGDGYPRNLSNQAPVLIKGKRFKISGKICMDQIMVDVGDLKVNVGDEVVLIGSQGKNKILTEELARISGTIPYEIVCGFGARIPRVYSFKEV